LTKYWISGIQWAQKDGESVVLFAARHKNSQKTAAKRQALCCFSVGRPRISAETGTPLADNFPE
jgi:hypothetical protein